jgi:hypothetical protein
VSPPRQQHDHYQCSFGDYFGLHFPHLTNASIHSSKVKRAGRYAENVKATGVSLDKAALAALAHFGARSNIPLAKDNGIEVGLTNLPKNIASVDPPEATHLCVPRSNIPLAADEREKELD